MKCPPWRRGGPDGQPLWGPQPFLPGCRAAEEERPQGLCLGPSDVKQEATRGWRVLWSRVSLGAKRGCPRLPAPTHPGARPPTALGSGCRWMRGSGNPEPLGSRLPPWALLHWPLLPSPPPAAPCRPGLAGAGDALAQHRQPHGLPDFSQGPPREGSLSPHCTPVSGPQAWSADGRGRGCRGGGWATPTGGTAHAWLLRGSRWPERHREGSRAPACRALLTAPTLRCILPGGPRGAKAASGPGTCLLCPSPPRGQRCVTWSYVLIPTAQPGVFSVEKSRGETVGGEEGRGRWPGAP